jgi:hypothetical protein
MKQTIRPSKEPSTLRQALDHRLNMYAVAAGAAGVGILSLSRPAEAKIVYTSANVKLARGGIYNYQFDLNHDGNSDFSFSYSGKSHGPHSAALVVQPLVKGDGIVGAIGLPADFPGGAMIGPKRRFGSESQQIMALWFEYSTQFYRGNWLNVSNRYLGLKFRIKGKVHYGWARLNVNIRPGDIEGTLTGYAYETIPNKPIIAGKKKGTDAIPAAKPATLGHLARGASAVSASPVK